MNDRRFEGGPGHSARRYERLAERLERGAGGRLREAPNELHPAEIADRFESLPARARDPARTCIDPALAGGAGWC